VTAQPVHHAHDSRVPDIAPTIGAIGDALSPEKRLAFYREALAAEAGEPITTVLRAWRAQAMLDRLPGDSGRRLADAAARTGGSSLEDLELLAGGW
jgi:hypothetical protein